MELEDKENNDERESSPYFDVESNGSMISSLKINLFITQGYETKHLLEQKFTNNFRGA